MGRILVKILIFLFSLIFVGILFYILHFSLSKQIVKELYLGMLFNTTSTTIKESARPIEEIKETEKDELILVPKISFSAYELEQGDTLIIVADNIPEKTSIKGKFNSQNLDFFPIGAESRMISILGIDAKKTPGEYVLSIFLSGELLTEQKIKIKKSDFYITKIIITPELEEKGLDAVNISKNISTKDGVIIYEIVNRYNPEIYFDKSFVYPLNEIINVGAFGNIRKDNGITIQHLGVDLDAKEGTPVYAINSGRVVFAEELVVYGKTIVIDHGLGIYSLYLHLSEFKVVEEEAVNRGEIIGLSGNTGWSTGPHLHLSLKINKASVDPLKFIDNFGILLKDE